MLDFMRRKAQSTYIQATIAIIILVFIFWGVGTSQKGGPDSIATVNGQSISQQKYQQNYNQTLARYQEQLGGALPPGMLEAMNLKQQVLNQMIQELVMQQGAREAGLIVGSEEVRKVIQGMDAFKEEGVFNLDRYKKMLTSSRMTIADFENSVRTDLIQNKILAHVSRFARVSDSELRERFTFDHDQIKLEYVAFSPDGFRSSGPVADQELNPFFEGRKQAYLTEPQVRIRYLAFLNEEGQNSDELKARQGKEQIFQLANKAYEGIIQAGSLEKYADKAGTKVLSTDYFTRANPPEALAGQPGLLETIFSLKKGELSSLVEIKDGYAIFSLEEVKEPHVPPLTEVRARVEKDFLAEQARTKAGEAAKDLLARAKKEGSLVSEAEKAKFHVLETPFFSRIRHETSGLPGPVAALGLKLGASSPFPAEIVENGNSYYVLHFKESKPASEEDFAEQKKMLLKMLTQEKQLQVMGAWLSYLQSRAEITTSLKDKE